MSLSTTAVRVWRATRLFRSGVPLVAALQWSPEQASKPLTTPVSHFSTLLQPGRSLTSVNHAIGGRGNSRTLPAAPSAVPGRPLIIE